MAIKVSSLEGFEDFEWESFQQKGLDAESISDLLNSEGFEFICEGDENGKSKRKLLKKKKRKIKKKRIKKRKFHFFQMKRS